MELTELTELTSGMSTFVCEAAKEWDGNDPIRTVGG